MLLAAQIPLYGLRTSPKARNKTIDKSLKRLYFTPTIFDPCLYFRKAGRRMHFILVNVDDIIILSTILTISLRLSKIPPKSIVLGQIHYSEKILERFDFLLFDTVRKSPLLTDASKLLAIPHSDHLTEEQIQFRDEFPYR